MMKERKRARGVLLGEGRALSAALVDSAVISSEELTWCAELGNRERARVACLTVLDRRWKYFNVDGNILEDLRKVFSVLSSALSFQPS